MKLTDKELIDAIIECLKDDCHRDDLEFVYHTISGMSSELKEVL